MADLSPNLSPYAALAKSAQSGIGSMDPSSILGLIQRSRELQTQSGIADAIRANPNDPTAAYGAAARNPNVFMGFGDVSNAVHAQQAQSELGRFNLEQVGKGIAGLYAKCLGTGKCDTNDLNQFQAMASTYMPGAANVLAKMHDTVVRPDGSLDPDGLLTTWNTISGGQQPLPTIGTQTAGGTKGQVPTAAAQYRGFVPQDIPGATEAGAVSPVVSAGQYGVAQKQAEQYKNEISPLLKMHELGTELGEQGLGKSTGVVTDLKNFLIASGADKYTDFDKDKTYKYEQLTKYSARLADQMSGGMTDARLIQAVGGNPNMGMNQQPFLSVLRYIIAMRRMQQVQFNEFSNDPRNIDPNTGNVNAGKFGQWSPKFLQQQDPRAYALDLMGKESATKLYQRMSDEEKARFNASRDLALKNGMGTGGL